MKVKDILFSECKLEFAQRELIHTTDFQQLAHQETEYNSPNENSSVSI